MHCKQIHSIAYVVIVLVAMTHRVGAANPVALFNGSDLTGWTYHLDKPNVKMEDVWSVKDGVLRCKGKPAGYLLTKKNDYRELRADSSNGAGRKRAATTACWCT